MAYERVQKTFGQSSSKKKHNPIVQPLNEESTQAGSQLSPKLKPSGIPSKEERDAIKRKIFDSISRSGENQAMREGLFSPTVREQKTPDSASTIGMPIQPKLTIGAPGDKYELEADRVAAQVVNLLNAPVTQQSHENQEREVLSVEEDELQMKPMVQLQSGAGGMTAIPEVETSIQQARGGGQPLADNIRQPMEQAFGADFSGVKVHTDAQADQLNQSIQAKAFTTGQDVFFRSGEYNPGSRGGQELIAHELTHVVQQNGGAVQRSPQPQELVATDRIAISSHMIQRVTADDVPEIIGGLGMEYQMHFQQETASFEQKGNLKEVRDDSKLNIWNTLKIEARKEGNSRKPKAKPEDVLAEWTVDDARKRLIKNADQVVKNSRNDRGNLRGEDVSPFINGGTIVKFDAKPFGHGTLEVIQGNKEVLLFAAHGFTHKEESLTKDLAGSNDDWDQEKAYGFMSDKYESVERNTAEPQAYKNMATQLKSEEDKYKIKGFPDVVVFPHYATDAISKEGEFLGELISDMDIAILRDWEWSDTKEGKILEKAFINTVPLKFILGSSPLNKYSKYLMQVCRAQWSRAAGVSGGGKRVSPKLTTW